MGANLVGAGVQPIDFRQFGAIFGSAAVVHAFIYLRANPFPEELTEQIATPSPFPINPHDEK